MDDRHGGDVMWTNQVEAEKNIGPPDGSTPASYPFFVLEDETMDKARRGEKNDAWEVVETQKVVGATVENPWYVHERCRGSNVHSLWTACESPPCKIWVSPPVPKVHLRKYHLNALQ